MNRLTKGLAALGSLLTLVTGSLLSAAQASPQDTYFAGSGPTTSHFAAGPGDGANERSAASSQGPAGVGVLTLDAGDLDETPNAGTGDYLVMEPWEYPRIPALKAANPRLRVLMYKDVSSVRMDSHETGIFSTGVSYAEAAAGHDEWFLTDGDGRRLEWSDWTGLYPMDVGNVGYQDRWADDVLTELRRHDWDGVMMDDTLTTLSHTTVGGRASVQIPDDAAMYRSTESFLARVGPRLKSAGYLAVPNLTVGWDTWKSTLSDWSGYVSGWENEYFVKWGLDTGSRFEGADWLWKVKVAAWCAARRLPLLAITYSSRTDRAAQVYHRATWLLTWNGHTGASVFVPAEVGANHWQPRANVVLGTPSGPRALGANGVWQRPYSAGLVLVNPTQGTQVVTVGTGYRNLAGRLVRQVRLTPLTGALLTR